MQWIGDTNGCTAVFTTLTVPMSQARNITSVFAKYATPVISGSVRNSQQQGLAGVPVLFSGNLGTVVTDTNGNYSLAVPYGWSGTVVPSTTGLGGAFSPAYRTYTRKTISASGQNFSWIPPPVISGRIVRYGTSTGLAGFTVIASGVGSATTDSRGNYSLTVPYGWTGLLAPSCPGGGVFSPGLKNFTSAVTASKSQNFSWKPMVALAVTTPSAETVAIALQGGFAQWAAQHGLNGRPADLFNQVAVNNGTTYGAQYAFGNNLVNPAPVVQLLVINGQLTAEVPFQDHATRIDARVTIEYLRNGSSIWFPAMCLSPNAATPATRQWFQAGTGEAADFRVVVDFIGVP